MHARDYMDAVQRASDGKTHEALRYGLGTDDVPIMSGMHEASMRICGATLTAAELIASGSVQRAFSIAGGLHHARNAQAAGFCILNDLASAVIMCTVMLGEDSDTDGA